MTASAGHAWAYPLLFLVGACVAFINSISGGGSIISLPVLIFLGLPSAVANGTNRLGVLFGSLASLAAFKSRGHFHPRLAWRVGWPAAIGSLAGSLLAVQVPDKVFKPLLAGVIIFVAIMTVKGRAVQGGEGEADMRAGWLAFAVYAAIGFYGGFIQAGSGLIMIYAFGRLGNLNIFQINSLKVFVTLIFITVSLLTFAAAGKVHWGYAAALSAGNLIGGWAGSHWQLSRSETWINRFILGTGLLMAAKLLWDTLALY
jgi:uncharacterized membrane protein YfcA